MRFSTRNDDKKLEFCHTYFKQTCIYKNRTQIGQYHLSIYMPHTQYKFLISAAVKFTIIFKRVSMIYNPNLFKAESTVCK